MWEPAKAQPLHTTHGVDLPTHYPLHSAVTHLHVQGVIKALPVVVSISLLAPTDSATIPF